MTARAVPQPEHFDFDSDRLPPADRFAHYCALYSAGADAHLLGPEFTAKVRAWRLDRLLIYDRQIDRVGHTRDAARVAADRFDHFTLTLVRDGRLEVDAGRGFRIIAPGEAVLADMRIPVRNRMIGAHIVTVSIARERLLGVDARGDDLHGHVLTVDAAGLLSDYVDSLLRRLATLQPKAQAAAATALGALVEVALENDLDLAGESVEPRRNALRLRRIRELTDANLSDPAFDADMLTDQSTLSRATLYRLLKPSGGIAAFILERRLQMVRTALIDPRDDRSFAAIAHASGFQSESHCSRLFLDRFGTRPGDYRADAKQDVAAGEPMLKIRLWENEIR